MNNFFTSENKPFVCLNKVKSLVGKDSMVHNCTTQLDNTQYVDINGYCCSTHNTLEDMIKNAKVIQSIHDINKMIDKIKELHQKLKGNNQHLYHLKKPTYSDYFNKIVDYIHFFSGLEENHRLLKKQYNELIFSPNQIVEKGMNDVRYLQQDRNLENYDKKNYSLYLSFFYMVLITSTVTFIHRQIK